MGLAEPFPRVVRPGMRRDSRITASDLLTVFTTTIEHLEYHLIQLVLDSIPSCWVTLAELRFVVFFFFPNEHVVMGMLLCATLALGDDSNAPLGAGMHSFLVRLLITVLPLCLGSNTGG
jgi:hypothetical protein